MNRVMESAHKTVQTPLRADLRIIAKQVRVGAKVLDVGCGQGELLAWLAEHKGVKGRGMELRQEGVDACIRKGLSVIQGDADLDLEYYPDQAFDVVVLSQTLQTLRHPDVVLRHLVRIGKHAVVSVPNFGHWKNRLALLLKGRMPVTKTLSHQWYDTPNIHFCTIGDFVELCEAMQMQIEQRLAVDKDEQARAFSGTGGIANWWAEHAVFVLAKK